MNILVACERSGVVRDAFAALGHDVVSCDIEPTDSPGLHYEGDVRDLMIPDYWDLMIAHPPCTHIAVSGARHFAAKRADGRQQEALDFVRLLLNAPVPRIALENPVSIISSQIRKPDQIIQPWQFGHDASKTTCLWLKNLPPLQHTKVIIKKRYANQTPSGQNKLGPSPTRAAERSKTYEGIAAAMADQWGDLPDLNDRQNVERWLDRSPTDAPGVR